MFRTLRNFIDSQNSRYGEEMKEAKSKVAAAKEKVAGNKVLCSLYLNCHCCYIAFIIFNVCYLQEKDLRKNLQHEMAKVVLSNEASFPMEEHDALLTKMKSDLAQAHAEVLKLKGTVPKGKRRCM